MTIDKHYYLYGFTWKDAARQDVGPGVDPRFSVEWVRWGRLTALTSVVGLDEVNPAKFAEETADFAWLSQAAMRHNQIILEAAKHAPVLPLRLGTLFRSRGSLLMTIARREKPLVDSLRGLEGREEWAVKAYFDERQAQEVPVGPHFHIGPRAFSSAAPQPAGSVGAQYLAAKRRRNDRTKEIQSAVRRELAAIGRDLQEIAESSCRLPPLSSGLVGRPEPMVWNEAFLVPRDRRLPFQAACQRFHDDERVRSNGLTVECTGPWPPYNFCPAFES